MFNLNNYVTFIHKALAQSPGDGLVTTDIPGGPVGDVGEYLNIIIPAVTKILGGVAFLVLIVAGYIYMTSQGDQTKVGLAKELIIGVITGILLLFLINVLKSTIGF